MGKLFKLNTTRWGMWIFASMVASSPVMAVAYKAFEEPLSENILIPAEDVASIKWLSWLEVSDKYLSLPEYYKQKTLESSPGFVHSLASSSDVRDFLNLADEAFGIQENILWLQKATDFVRHSKIYSLDLHHRIIQKATILRAHCFDVYDSRFKNLLISITGERAIGGFGAGTNSTSYSQIEFVSLTLTKPFAAVELIFADGIPLNIQNRKVLIPVVIQKAQSGSRSLEYWLVSAQNLPLMVQYSDFASEKLAFQPIVSGNCKESQWNWLQQKKFNGQLFFSASCVRPIQNPEVLHPRPVELDWQSNPIESEQSVQIKKWTIIGIVGGSLAYLMSKR